MDEIVWTLIESLNINVLVFAAIGALMGESQKELTDGLEMQLSKFITNILLSFGAAVTLGTIVYELTGKVFISAFAALLSGKNGHKLTWELLNTLLKKFFLDR